MSINNITQTISTLPPAGKRGIDVQTQFVIKQEDFQDHLQGTTVTELNTLKDQFNSRINEINSTTTTMNGYANTASAGASTATTKAGEASTSASDALSYKNQAETFKNNASASATKASQWADNNYNVEVEAGKYSAKHWSTVAQNATANKIDKVASTDNAVVRFDGVTGQVQDSSILIDDNGNLNITGVGKRITGDFSNATFGNRVIFQTSTNNSNTIVSAIPNGTATETYFSVRNNSDADNASNTSLGVTAGASVIGATKTGTGSYLPLTFVTSDTERVRIDTEGNVGIGTSSPGCKLNVVESSFVTVARFENTSGHLGTYTGIALNCNNSSSNAYKGMFYDFRNENNIALAGVHCDVNTDGSSEIYFDTTPAGVRTTDRRVTAGKFTKTGDFLLTSGTGALGYGTGAGGVVTQLTNKNTAVTLNKPCGTITCSKSSLGANGHDTFLLYNSLIQAGDHLLVNMVYGTGTANVYTITSEVGSSGGVASIGLWNFNQSTAFSEAIQIRFSIIKGATA